MALGSEVALPTTLGFPTVAPGRHVALCVAVGIPTVALGLAAIGVIVIVGTRAADARVSRKAG